MQTNVNHFQIQAKFKFLHQLLEITDWNELTSLLFTIIHQSEQGQIIALFENLKMVNCQSFVLKDCH